MCFDWPEREDRVTGEKKKKKMMAGVSLRERKNHTVEVGRRCVFSAGLLVMFFLFYHMITR